MMHVKTEHEIHNFEENVKCVRCNSKCYIETDLRGWYGCKNCDPRNYNVDTLKEHRRDHVTDPPENNQMCETRGKQDTILETLKQHDVGEHLVQPPEVNYIYKTIENI